jgi:hypothetical protein
MTTQAVQTPSSKTYMFLGCCPGCRLMLCPPDLVRPPEEPTATDTPTHVECPRCGLQSSVTALVSYSAKLKELWSEGDAND